MRLIYIGNLFVLSARETCCHKNSRFVTQGSSFCKLFQASARNKFKRCKIWNQAVRTAIVTRGAEISAVKPRNDEKEENRKFISEIKTQKHLAHLFLKLMMLLHVYLRID